MRWFILAAAAISSALAVSVHADQVIFNNGDTLTGKIESMEGGKMIFASDKAGKVTIDMKDLKTFSSSGTIAIKMTDGTIVNQKIDAGPDGQVAIAPGGAIQPQNLPIASIKTVNFKEDWTGSIVAGGTLTRGNTDTDSLNLNINAVRRTERDRFTIEGGFLYGRQRTDININGVQTSHKSETANDWFIGAKYDYFFTPKFYGYINGRLERDLIAGISLRVTPGAGIGYQWFDQADLHFRTEAGISYLYRSYTHDGGTDESVAARLAYHVDKKLNDKVGVFHNMEYFPGLDSINDYYFITDAGIRADLTTKMFSEFKIVEQYDSQPAPGKGHNDTRFILGVGWNF